MEALSGEVERNSVEIDARRAQWSTVQYALGPALAASHV
jgi:hypothetical protein